MSLHGVCVCTPYGDGVKKGTAHAVPLDHRALFIDRWEGPESHVPGIKYFTWHLLYVEMSDNTWAAENNNNKVKGIDFPSQYNKNRQNVSNVRAYVGMECESGVSGECRKWE